MHGEHLGGTGLITLLGPNIHKNWRDPIYANGCISNNYDDIERVLQISDAYIPFILLTLFLLACPYMASLSKNIDFYLRRDHQKNSYDRRYYESVDEKSA